MYFNLNALANPPNPLPPKSETILPLEITTTTILLALALFTYGLRIWMRTRTNSSLGWDDLTITLAMVLTVACYFGNVVLTIKTGGLHTWYIPENVFEIVAKLSFIIVVLFVWAATMVKISVCFMLLRIKSQSRPWFIGLWSLIIFLLCMVTAVTVCYMVMCNPIAGNWSITLALTDPNACWPQEVFVNFTYAFSSVFAATDVICALLPIVFIRKINRPLRERCVLALLMALGLVAAACGLMKMILLKGTLNSNDPSYAGVPTQIWAFSEVYIGVICANIPCLRALLEKLFSALGGHLSTRGTRLSRSVDQEDYEMAKGLKQSNDQENSYHSAIRSMHDAPETKAKRGSELAGLRYGRESERKQAHENELYVTTEYEVSWEEKRQSNVMVAR